MNQRQLTLSGDEIKPTVEGSVSGSCARCGTERATEKHHINYVPEQKITLCRDCHKQVHSMAQSEFAPKQDPNRLFESPPSESDVPAVANVTIKRINNNSYFYWNWRDGGNIKSKFICKVSKAKTHELFKGGEL